METIMEENVFKSFCYKNNKAPNSELTERGFLKD
jgi:hypothetical protein